MHLRENAADGVGKRRDFYPLLLNRVLSNEKRRRKKLKGKAGDLFWCTGDAVNTGGGRGDEGRGNFQAKRKRKKELNEKKEDVTAAARTRHTPLLMKCWLRHEIHFILMQMKTVEMFAKKKWNKNTDMNTSGDRNL